MYIRNSASLFFLLAAAHAISNGLDYESLPLDTIFPGPWESNIKAPANKSQIVPVKIFKSEGAVSGAETVLHGVDKDSGVSWIVGPGGLITFEFVENIAGRVCFAVNGIKNDPYISLSYSESPFFAGREADATGDRQARDLPLKYQVKNKGVQCVESGYNRGAFKYLTVFMPEEDEAVESARGSSYDGHYFLSKPSSQTPWYDRVVQQVLGWGPEPESEPEESSVPGVSISAIWVNCTAFPSNPNGRAYTGYFDSSSSLLNRIWYAGAWTLQLSTIDPREGGSDIDYNRNFDHNDAPQGAWYSNYTVANGTTCTTDGAKRDRMVWPGDMTIAVPGIAVSTYDMLAVRNALDTIYDHQYHDGSMPYAGPPMGAFGEFSDTYHLHTLVGTYAYVLYSGDLDWLKRRWPAYTKALQISIDKVDENDLLHVSSVFDWIRPGMTGHNVEASAILYEVLGNSILLASWLDEKPNSRGEIWSESRSRLEKGIATLYCKEDGLYSDNMGRRGCQGEEKVLPQDGNSWVLLSQASTAPKIAYNVSENLRARWLKYGAPAVEFPNVISPFASSFELLGHIGAGNADAAVELMELMWGYMLNGPGMTNSTLIEGYRVDGGIHYPAYWSEARNSHAHGWSAGPTTVLMQGILGITLTSPLGKTWRIEPRLTKWLSYAQGGFATKLGKFEVSVSLMRSHSTGRKVEVLKGWVPEGTSGYVIWGGKEQFITANEEYGTTFKFFRYLEGSDEGFWYAWSVREEAMNDLVKDDDWVKPEVEERPLGVVDWDALEANYGLAKERLHLSRAWGHINTSVIPSQLENEDVDGLEEENPLLQFLKDEAEIQRKIDEERKPLKDTKIIQGLKLHFAAQKCRPSREIQDASKRMSEAAEGLPRMQNLESAVGDWAERVKIAEAKTKENERNRVLNEANQDWAQRVKIAEEEARTARKNLQKEKEELK